MGASERIKEEYVKETIFYYISLFELGLGASLSLKNAATVQALW
jgi:hypothetical protein